MDFKDIVKMVLSDDEINFKKLKSHEIITYIALQMVYFEHKYGLVTKQEASDYRMALHSNYVKLSTRLNFAKARDCQHQDFIVKAREMRSCLNGGFGIKSDSELLELAVKCIATMCCDKMMMNRFYEKHKKRCKNVQS